MTPLPRPATARFQPLRSGLLNLFKYQDQEFWFEKGRLLIRGNNGTGKSRVLALQLPFLFDGEISSRRVEPDGDPARQMAWHLLMDDLYEQRTGYTWIEFGRRDGEGRDHYVTLGCGLKAVRGGDNQPSRWYFITGKRIGESLALHDGGTPRSAERLHEALEAEDFFSKTAKEYRAEVNRRLFGMGTGAYAALNELLIRLRAPQLSKKLDEKSLFEALSQALPPLAAEVVEQVANAFKQLEDLRQQYQTLRDLQEALSQFRIGYQVYLQTLLLRRADEVTSRHSRYEKANRDVNGLQQTIAAGEARQAEAEALVAEAQHHLTACEAAHSTLQTRPEANLAQELDDAGRNAGAEEQRLQEARSRAAKAEERSAERSGERDRQSETAAQAIVERRQLEQTATDKAAPAGFAADHTDAMPAAEHWPADAKAMLALKQTHQQQADDHLYRLEQMEEAQQRVNTLMDATRAARGRENLALEKVEAGKEQVQRHHRDAQAAEQILAAAYRAWRDGLRWLKLPYWPDVAGHFADWLGTDAAEHRVLAGILSAASQKETETQAALLAALRTRQEKLEQEQTMLVEEATALRAAPAAPALPRVRAAALENRTGRPGAPLWRLCDFQPHLNEPQRAGLEAALEAAGLLDAWIFPDGRMQLPGMAVDSFLQIETSPLPGQPGPILADALCLEAGADAVSGTVLREVLQQIGLGRGVGRHWVGLDGEWQLGPLHGRGEKPVSEFLGKRSREAARARRMQEIEAESLRLSGELDKATTELTALDTRKAEAAMEAASAPRDDEVARQLALRTNARALVNEATALFDAAVQETQRAEQEAAREREAFESLVRQLGYGAHLSRIGELRAAWADYNLAMLSLWSKAEACRVAAEHLERAEAALRQAGETHTADSEAAEKAETSAIAARQRFESLRATVGVSVSEYQTLLSEARQAKQEAVVSLDQRRSNLSEIEKHLSGVRSQVPEAENRINEAETSREEAISALRVAFENGVFEEADEQLREADSQLWSATRAVAIARGISKTLTDLERDDAAWMQRLNALDARINELRTRTGAGCPIESQQLLGGLTLIICVYQGTRLRPAECLLAVERERATHDRLLAEEERRIIDRHLVTEVSIQLQHLIEQAQERTANINKEMARCATTLGVAMKLVWEVRTDDQHPALPAVRKLLLMDHGVWSDEQRRTVGTFLHQLIQDERSRNPAAPAAEQLLTALDYRRWHAFSAERHQNGRWERLTRKRYGTGSGGEKALMLTIPQMAAAASHYSSAAPHAPRFILLDEAFAGMDKPTRGRCMGLLEAFDLDLMMTSEREHGAHASVSGIAIYQLVADATAVDATRWVWNGSQSLLTPVPDTPELRHP